MPAPTVRTSKPAGNPTRLRISFKNMARPSRSCCDTSIPSSGTEFKSLARFKSGRVQTTHYFSAYDRAQLYSPSGSEVPQLYSMISAVLLLSTLCVPDQLFQSLFRRPTGHAPYAQFQPRPLQPHEGEPIVAQEEDITKHFRDAQTSQIPYISPGAQEHPDLLQAAGWLARQLAENNDVGAIRSGMVVKFASAMLRFQQQSQGLIPLMSPTVYEISRRYNIQGMQHLIDELQYPDATLAQCFLTGFDLVGYLQETGIHRSKLSPATENPYRCHHADNKRLVGSIRRRAMKATPEQLADLQECYDKSLQEVTEGWAEGPFSFNDLCERFPNGFWAMRRNAHRRYPDAPVRPVDDARRSGHNKATHCSESISCENADFGCRMAAIFHSMLGPTMMHIGTDDLTKAFRQLPCSEPHFNVVAQWDPKAKLVRFFVLRGLPFGCVSSVLHFNRLPAFICTVMRCYFGVCVTNFYDDYCIAEPASTAASAQWCLRRVHEILGFLLDPSKHMKAAVMNPFLGVVTDFSQVLHGVVIFRIKNDRRQKLLRALQALLDSRKCTPASASSMRGKLYFTAGTCFGRIGVPALQAFTNRQYSSATRLTPALTAAILFFIALLTDPPPKVTQFIRSTRKVLLVWSDAMLQDGVGRLGFVVHDPSDDLTLYSSYLVPQWMLLMFAHPLHCIGQLEIMAALMVYITLDSYDPDMVRDRDIIHFVDNTSAIMGLYKGYSPSPDSCRLIQIFHLLMARMNFRVWWEWVASKANISDLPSRDDYDLLIRWAATWVAPEWMTAETYNSSFKVWLVRTLKRDQPGSPASPSAHRQRMSGGARRIARASGRSALAAMPPVTGGPSAS